VEPENRISSAQGRMSMRTAIAFDVYGTLVSPLAMADHLKSLFGIGDRAARFTEPWRAKQP
jgi:2-haloacid dehalogenase